MAVRPDQLLLKLDDLNYKLRVRRNLLLNFLMDKLGAKEDDLNSVNNLNTFVSDKILNGGKRGRCAPFGVVELS